MKILYFAWIRERIGLPSEDIALSDDIQTVQQFLDWMKTRGENYQYALEQDQVVRIALNQQHCTDFSTNLKEVNEIAIFPPMTGG